MFILCMFLDFEVDAEISCLCKLTPTSREETCIKLKLINF